MNSNRAGAIEAVRLLLKLGNALQPESMAELRKVAKHTDVLRNVQADRVRVQQDKRAQLRRQFWTVMMLRAARRGDAELIQVIMSVRSTKPAPEINCRSKVTKPCKATAENAMRARAAWFSYPDMPAPLAACPRTGASPVSTLPGGQVRPR